ncbi:MAG: 5-formyltetrahydrofolate cyclo-ligase [Prevotella sp.]|nr:5-formyltetrahydrofolate cyclo-ligase [Prevotella sp.]
MEKKELRQFIRNIKRQFSEAELSELSLDVISRLFLHPRVSAAETLLAYYSLPDEVDTHKALFTWTSEGKTVLLPHVVDGERMELRAYSPTEDMQEGAFHIMEPTGARYTLLENIDVAIIPGMAFDTAGNRLGRGRGYYDRLLARLSPHTYKIGICFPFQKVDSLPHSSFDVPVDEVI